MLDLPIVISGGGIGGLATACGLAQKGFRSIVVEQTSQLGEIGAGIQIGPNAFHCFDYFGIGDEMRSIAIYIDRLRLMDAKTAEDITSIPLDESFRKFYGNPYAVVHRADLHGVLLEFCQNSPLVDIRTSHLVTGYDQDDMSATLFCKDHDPITGLCVIGAEGLRSPTRQQMIGDGEPCISGHTTYRSVIPTEQMPEDLRWNAATLWAGPKCHIVHYPLRGWKAFNLVVTYHRDLQQAFAGKSVSKEEVVEGFEHIHPKARQIIEHGSDWKLWVLCDRDPISNWVDGRVALLGDSAHPMLQYFAQGACMAMEDAVALTYSVEHCKYRIEDALQNYQAMRKVRTARVQMNSRLIGDYIYHPDDAQAAVRNHVMRNMSAEDWFHQLNWLYGSNGLDAG